VRATAARLFREHGYSSATLALLTEVPAGGSATERLRTLVRLQVEHVASTPDELVVFFQELPWIDRPARCRHESDVQARRTCLRPQAVRYAGLVQAGRLLGEELAGLTAQGVTQDESGDVLGQRAELAE
jgi:hypothetical protein